LWSSPSKTRDPIPKITKAKLARAVAQVVECLPSKREALSSNPRTKKLFSFILFIYTILLDPGFVRTSDLWSRGKDKDKNDIKTLA
jgi:hypothetical protein